METVTLSHRDQAVLRAVAGGRTRLSGRWLFVDGVYYADQFAGRRLVAAGLITEAGALTASAESLLHAA
jgi:hypothetical protein